MKATFGVFCLIVFALAATASVMAEASDQDSTGLPGDNFSLQGALEMFKKAGSPEEFEKLLNTQENHVNNLDLNNDGEIDYVRVVDKAEKGAHALVLQVPVSEKENQDIAVIAIEKTGDSTAVVQIIGDEDIYGEQAIVEPEGEGGGDEEDMDGEEEEKGPNMEHAMMLFSPRVVVNVWFWPSVRFVYAPAYVAWVSPWRWRAYPVWWRPWRPLAWRVFHPFRVGYRAGFVIAPRLRVVHARRVYAPVRATSVTVRTRYHGPVTHYRKTTTIKTKGGTVRKTTTRTRVGRRR